MATLLDPNEDLRAGADERGASLARSKSLDARPGQSAIDQGTQDAEDFANDPANASGKSRSTNASGSSTDSSPKDRLKDKNPSSGSSGGGGGLSGIGNRAGAIAAGAGAFVGKNKKKFGVGGGVAGILFTVIFGFLALLPLKLESMMKNLFERRVGSRVERYMERRADSMMARYFLSSVGASDAQFERSIVATGKPIQDLYKIK